jgi:hypothetical protein
MFLGRPGEIEGEGLLFVNKKKQKNFFSWARAGEASAGLFNF